MPENEPCTTVKTHCMFLLMYPDPDGDWVVYGRTDNEELARKSVETYRESKSAHWQVVRQIVTEEVLDA
jgi:hypothetical protein